MVGTPSRSPRGRPPVWGRPRLRVAGRTTGSSRPRSGAALSKGAGIYASTLSRASLPDERDRGGPPVRKSHLSRLPGPARDGGGQDLGPRGVAEGGPAPSLR